MGTLGAVFRLAGAGLVLAREGAFAFIDPAPLPAVPRLGIRLAKLFQRRNATDAGQAERLTSALNRLGPSYVKLGQFLATRPDIVGQEFSNTLGKLRDEIAPFPESEARSIIEASLHRPVSEIFVDLSPPLAAASIAQVHKGVIAVPDGTRTVAVKVLRPGVRRRFRRDLETFYEGARLVERLDPAARRLRPVAVVDTLARGVTIEMDLRLEAAALSEMAENTKQDGGFRVPKVEWELTARDVLTLEWIDGIKLSDINGLREAGLDLPLLARRLMQAFLRHALRDGFFHADMHQGNLFVEADGTIVAVDFGIMGRLGKDERRFLAEILFGFIRRDYRRVAEVHFEAGYVPGGKHNVEDFAQALRAIGEPIHGQRASDISMAKLLTLLFEVTELFDMQTRPELLLVQKTMVVVEGVSRSLDPDFDMWSASEPVVREWIERYLGPAGQISLVAEGVGSIGRLVAELPKLADRAERLSAEMDRMGTHGLRLDPETIEEIGRSEARAGRAGRVALVVMAVVAVLVGLKFLF
ncbi:MAG: 2-polyprenylphenol 6-hydroxylase [Rhizobiales bacterium]|nr:2-polyprenylphenol 6-hydroxylase [Hyphomicrobiales bacterium]